MFPVDPEPDEFIGRRRVRGCDQKHALEDLRDVSQIKGVVELGWGREEFGGDGVVDLDRRGDDAACAERRGRGGAVSKTPSS